MTLRWQIALALAAIAAAVGSAAGIGSYLTTERELQTGLDQSLRSLATVVIAHAGPRGGNDGGRIHPSVPFCPDPGDLTPAAAVELTSASGSTTSCITGAVDLPESILTRDGIRSVRIEGRSYRVYTARYAGGTLAVARSLGETDRLLDALRLRLAALVGAGVAVALAAGWLLARSITRPIGRLRQTAETIATTGDLDTPVPVDGPREVSSLGHSFTAMVSALATSRDQQRRLVDDASHEMRTPLTSLTSNLEHLGHLADLPEHERREVLDAVQVDVGELTNLLTELVELATDRADDEEPEALSLVALVRDVAQRSARRSGRTIEVRESEPARQSGERSPALVVVRAHMLERAVANLIDNAIKYGPDDSPISAVVSGGRLEVSDRGPGIDRSDRDHVFDRFYRAPSARTSPGSGLGLAIVRQVVERHGGRVWVGEPPDGVGAVVGFELPVAP